MRSVKYWFGVFAIFGCFALAQTVPNLPGFPSNSSSGSGVVESFWHDAGAGYIYAAETIKNRDGGATWFGGTAGVSTLASLKPALILRYDNTISGFEAGPPIQWSASTGPTFTTQGVVWGAGFSNSNQVAGLNLQGNNIGFFTSAGGAAGSGSKLGSWLTGGEMTFDSASTGVNAITFSNNGARLNLGSGTLDYLISDGTGIVTPGRLYVGDAGLFVDGVARLVTDGGARSDIAMYTGTAYQGALRASANTATGLEVGLNLAIPSGKAFGIYTEAGGGTTHVFRDYGTLECNQSSGNNAIQFNTTGARFDFGAGGSDYLVSDGTGIETPSYVEAGDYVQGASGLCSGTACAGTAFASFPAAAGGNATRLRADSTNNVLRYSTGAAWLTVAYEIQMSAFLPLGVATSGSVVVQETRIFNPSKVVALSVVPVVAGTGGGNFVAKVIDTTSATTLCTVTAGPCSAAGATSSTFACTGAVAKNDIVRLEFDTSGCTTSPAINVVATIIGG